MTERAVLRQTLFLFEVILCLFFSYFYPYLAANVFDEQVFVRIAFVLVNAAIIFNGNFPEFCINNIDYTTNKLSLFSILIVRPCSLIIFCLSVTVTILL